MCTYASISMKIGVINASTHNGKRQSIMGSISLIANMGHLQIWHANASTN